ncbi:hypothetical protein GCM10010329_06080 [Streptomyces spiroverticillatus]|uniref:Uncharacterized protein n=1 Tax=Streptomyces finlayi TaxID=67296 RepID=A0A919C7J7_9ACTN|nr:hypothetical protein [Streptomyces finlayi]GGZ88677.1 hypothetical protein GCM10010329_06080 [Streptomyces spiroverticillatus]GHC79643.1 hypothetical protein GCM10010334_06060 [Streptomyces finlayi]
MSAPEREVEKPMTSAAPAPAPVAPVSMSALLASCAAATAVSTPPRETAASPDTEKGTAGRREAA